jgi:hypothetical protein
MSADARVVAAPTGSGATVLRRDEHRLLRVGPQGDVRLAAVSPDGAWVATASHGPQNGAGVKIWDARSGRHVKDLPAPAHGNLCFSPDGKWLLTAGGGLRLWKVGTWQQGPNLGALPLTNAGVFSPDSKLLALGGAPGVVQLLAVDTGKEIARLTAPEPIVLWPCCFTPNGAQLVTAGPDTQALHIFDLRAIRSELAELELDWSKSAVPAAPAAREPLRVTIDEGNLRQRLKANEPNYQAYRHALKKEYDRALAALREAVRIDPTYAAAHNNLAWLLAVGPEKLRNPEEALRLARKAVELAPKRSDCHSTLGAALYRTGRVSEAVPVLEESLRTGKGRADAFDLFFLAMCHHRLGDAAQARDCFDRGARWFAERKARMSPLWLEQLSTLQAEANALLRQPVPARKE